MQHILAWWLALSAEAMAAWVQAVGALLAIAATAFIAFSQERRSTKSRIAQRRLTQHITALDILPQVEEWNTAITRALMVLPEYSESTSPDEHQAYVFLMIEQAFQIGQLEMYGAEAVLVLGAPGVSLHDAIVRSRRDLQVWSSMRPTLNSRQNAMHLIPEVRRRIVELSVSVSSTMAAIRAIADEARRAMS